MFTWKIVTFKFACSLVINGILENGVDGLQFTRAWVTKNATKARSQHQNAASAACAASASLVPESFRLGNPESERKWLSEIMNAAFMDLLEWNDDKEIFPEV